VPSNISTSSQLSNRRSTGLKTTQSSLSVNSGSIAEKDATIDPSLFAVCAHAARSVWLSFSRLTQAIDENCIPKRIASRLSPTPSFATTGGIILFPSSTLAAHQVPPEVVALPAGERLEALDNRIAEIKWRLETEEIILDRLNKLNLQVRVLLQ
jgi:hypothetical protein